MTSDPRRPAQLRQALLDALHPAARATVDAVVAAASPNAVFAVGGTVRDLILGRPIRDVDLAVEGDAITLLRSALPGAPITTHARFGTARAAADRTSIDIVSTRSETYARPGALPHVRPGSIDDDLRRRDFTINAMALRLTGAPELLDPTGGLADIERRLIRVLHDRSFVDDATRMFRAARYAARLGFAIEAGTARLLERDAGYVSTLSPARVRREIELLLLEDTGGEALRTPACARLLPATHPALSWDDARAAALGEPPVRVPRLPYGFALLAATADAAAADAIVARLRLRRDESAAVRGVAALREAAHMLRRKELKPSGVVMLLERYPLASIAAFAATSDDTIAANLALRYLAEWRHVKPALTGDDLVELGVPRGPQVQRGIQLIRAARLDGWADDEGDERALALRFAKSIRDAASADAPIELQVNGN
jgi:tRNA nucleotidyltransferase (CCA-adding enzyme)